MLERKPRREAGTSWMGAAPASGHFRQMLLTLVLLLIALGAVVARNSEIWFGADQTTDAQDTTPVWNPNQVIQTPSEPSAPSAPAVAVQKHLVAKDSTRPAVSRPAHVAASRAVLPPLNVEVVAGDTRRTFGTGSNSLKVETMPGTGSNASAKATQWGPATTASERVRMSADQSQNQLQPAEVSYPLLGRQMKVQGAVLLQALISADGVIQELRVLSGPAILASAAREAALQWKFKPYLQNGRPVETQARITVSFTIKVLDNATRDQQGPVVMSMNGES
jgi:protein TonB